MIDKHLERLPTCHQVDAREQHKSFFIKKRNLFEMDAIHFNKDRTNVVYTSVINRPLVSLTSIVKSKNLHEFVLYD